MPCWVSCYLFLGDTGGTMAKHKNPPRIHLPRGWLYHVKSAVLHVIALGQYAMAYTRSWAVNGRIAIRERGMTIDAIRQLFRYAPCWELTGCGNRETRPTFNRPHEPCYRQRASGEPMPCDVDCQRCSLYYSKESARECIVVRPADGPPGG
jgi:hypothetical protein